jgi:hypothetical protein
MIIAFYLCKDFAIAECMCAWEKGCEMAERTGFLAKRHVS